MLPSDFEWPLSQKTNQEIARIGLAPIEWSLTAMCAVLTFVTIVVLSLRSEVNDFRTSFFSKVGSTGEEEEKEVLRRSSTVSESLGGDSDPPDIKGKGMLDPDRYTPVGDLALSAREPLPDVPESSVPAVTEPIENPVGLEELHDALVDFGREDIDAEEAQKNKKKKKKKPCVVVPLEVV